MLKKVNTVLYCIDGENEAFLSLMLVTRCMGMLDLLITLAILIDKCFPLRVLRILIHGDLL